MMTFPEFLSELVRSGVFPKPPWNEFNREMAISMWMERLEAYDAQAASSPDTTPEQAKSK